MRTLTSGQGLALQKGSTFYSPDPLAPLGGKKATETSLRRAIDITSSPSHLHMEEEWLNHRTESHKVSGEAAVTTFPAALLVVIPFT